MIKEKFEHYILTCFNINRGFDSENKRNSSEYLDSRFAIFESITVPSVEAQSCCNFSWLVFFDIDTPEKYKRKIELITKSGIFIPFYVKDYNDIQDILKKQLKLKTEYLVTTNLDNDDAIAGNFVEILQSKFIEEEVYLINFLMGYMLSERGLFMREYYSSPFHTLSERVSDEIISCLNVPHNFLYNLKLKGLSLYQIVCEPSWLQIVHGSNVRNKIEINAIPIFNLKSLERFHLKKIPYDFDNYSDRITNRFNSAFLWFKRKMPKFKKRRKNSSILIFKLKLALYTLVPHATIIYNKYKILISLSKKPAKSKISLGEFRELLSNKKTLSS